MENFRMNTDDFKDLENYIGPRKVKARRIRAINGNLIILEWSDSKAFTVSDEFLKKFNPKAGDYFIVYEDNSEGVLPRDTFESLYIKT